MHGRIGLKVFGLITLLVTTSYAADMNWKTIWSPNEADIIFQGPGKSALTSVNDFSGFKVITRQLNKGPNNIAQYKTAMRGSYSHLRVSFWLYFADDFEFPQKSHKLPLGLWGGVKGAVCLSGGCSHINQDGFSIRLVQEKGVPGLYIYSLNRKVAVDAQGIQYGTLIKAASTLTPGKWHHFSIEVVLNDIGLANGSALLHWNGNKVVVVNDIVFRKDENWKIRGPLLTDMLGGNIYDSKSMSVKDQMLAYRNYSIEIPPFPLNKKED